MAQPMAVGVVGGMIYGTLLTLVVVPCIYDIFMKEKDMRDEDLDDDRFDKPKDELDEADAKEEPDNADAKDEPDKEKVIIQDAWGREMK